MERSEFPSAHVGVCHYRIPYWEAHTLQKFTSHSLEPGKSKVKVLAYSVSGEGPLPGSWVAVFFLSPHMVEGAGEAAVWGSNPIHKGSVLMTYSLPKASPPTAITWGLRISTYEFLGNTNLQSVVVDTWNPVYVYMCVCTDLHSWSSWCSLPLQNCSLEFHMQVYLPWVFYILDDKIVFIWSPSPVGFPIAGSLPCPVKKKVLEGWCQCR